MRTPIRFAALALLVAGASGHVGSSTVFFAGSAGPYSVRVVIRPPMVVPGLADVTVRAVGSDIAKVVIRPVFWSVGTRGSPKGDVIKRVPGDPSTYTGQLWLMQRGSYSVFVTVEGGAGAGSVIVPVVSMATGRLALSGFLAVILIAFGVLLVAGLVSIVRAAVGESVVAPGEIPPPQQRRRGRVAATIAAVVIGAALLGGARWWGAVDDAHDRFIEQPLTTMPVVTIDGSVARMSLDIRFDGDTSLPLPVIPDHGKSMHLFLVRDSSLSAFAHLHPVRDGVHFVTALPPLPAGRYRVYADIVRPSGKDHTLAAVVDIPPLPLTTRTDDIDDGFVADLNAVPVGDGARARLADGSTVEWRGESALVAGRPVDMRMIFREPSGEIARVEPYMGMAAHAVVLRHDGSVYVHLHPMGTVSAAAQQAFLLRERGDTTADGIPIIHERSASIPMHHLPVDGVVVFPYEFPRDGRYRVWVQVRRNGRILTGVFDVDVAPRAN